MSNLIKLLNSPITNYKFSVRIHNFLKKEKITFIKDLIVYSHQGLMSCENIGHNSANIIKDEIEDLGLNLGMNPKFLQNIIDEGVGLKDDFASKAMQAILTGSWNITEPIEVAKKSYEYANAMIKFKKE